MAGLFDELMGAAQSLTGRPGGVTGRLTIRYRDLTPLDTDLVFRCWVERDRGMRVDMRAECVRPTRSTPMHPSAPPRPRRSS